MVSSKGVAEKYDSEACDIFFQTVAYMIRTNQTSGKR